MTVWADVEAMGSGEITPSAAVDLQADRLGALEARTHALTVRADDLIAQLKRQAQQLAAHQVAIVRLVKGETPCTGILSGE